MSQPQNDPLLDHEYDGIREYDNPMPGWWKAIFIISIIFAISYAGAAAESPSTRSLRTKWPLHANWN